MPSLKKLLIIKSNNYTKLAKFFNERTGLDIINDGYTQKVSLSKSCSIIIPFYKNYLFLKRNLIALQHQNLPYEFKQNKIEIIIINDGSSINLKSLIQQTKKFYPVIYLELKKNYCSATARNLGLLYAQNEIIIFLDEDIVVPKDFLATHLLRHEFLDKCIIVGLRHDINLKNLILRLDSLKQNIIKLPSYKKDFRYKKLVSSKWKDVYKDVPTDNFNKVYYLLKESDYFKKFGKGKIIGVWDLPFMSLACNISVPRKYILEVGGFDIRFKGWGMEDVNFGAKLIARGLYLIPNLHATVYHLIRKNFVEEKRRKIEEFKRNFKLYKKLENENQVLFNGNKWKEKMKKYFVSKVFNCSKLQDIQN